MRDMTRQEGRLDPKRGQVPAAPAERRDAIALALEKRFGRPQPFLEESSWTAPEGGMVWRIKTEHGAVCLMEMPPTAMMSAPGQGAGKTLMVPMPCN